MKRVNFQNPGPLTSISEGQSGEDSGSLASEDLGMEFERSRPRHHSIHEIIAAKAASKVFKAKMLAARKTKRRDDGFVEITHADYPLVRDDTLYSRGKSATAASVRSSSVNVDDSLSRTMKYSMEPLRRFQEPEVKQIIKSVFIEQLSDKDYTADMCRFTSRVCADIIKEKVKRLFLPRYKFICLVHMGQIGQQSMRVASRCSWDTRVDDFAEYCYMNGTLWAVGLVYGIYCE
ncbi:dynein light chain Tctex-type 5-like isoform X2 [Rhopilema esculentum]|eukprot:gene17230-8785_t